MPLPLQQQYKVRSFAARRRQLPLPRPHVPKLRPLRVRIPVALKRVPTPDRLPAPAAYLVLPGRLGSATTRSVSVADDRRRLVRAVSRAFRVRRRVVPVALPALLRPAGRAPRVGRVRVPRVVVRERVDRVVPVRVRRAVLPVPVAIDQPQAVLPVPVVVTAVMPAVPAPAVPRVRVAVPARAPAAVAAAVQQALSEGRVVRRARDASPRSSGGRNSTTCRPRR